MRRVFLLPQYIMSYSSKIGVCVSPRFPGVLNVPRSVLPCLDCVLLRQVFDAELHFFAFHPEGFRVATVRDVDDPFAPLAPGEGFAPPEQPQSPELTAAGGYSVGRNAVSMMIFGPHGFRNADCFAPGLRRSTQFAGVGERTTPNRLPRTSE